MMALLLEPLQFTFMTVSYTHLHPIVDPLSRRIIAFEAIVQKNEDSPSAIAVGQRKDEEIYTADLKSQALAFAMAHALKLGDKMISINLLPMTLVRCV